VINQSATRPSGARPFTAALSPEVKAYQQLVDDGLVESRRGRGMFVNSGARELLLAGERQRFLGEEWPRIYANFRRLGLRAEELLAANGGWPTESAAPKTGEPKSPDEES